MKNLLKIFSVLALLFAMVNCDDNSDVEFKAPEDSFAITSPNNGASVILDGTNTQNVAVTIVWEDNVTESSSYSVEMSFDSEFTSSILLGTSSNNTFSMTAEEFNAVLLSNDIPAFEETPLYFRVVADSQSTEVINLTLSPYPENPPVITAPDSTFEVVLSDITEDETAMTVTWDDPDFSEDTSVAIDYYVEFITTNGTVSYQTTERSLDFTHATLNDIALNLGLAVDTAAGIDVTVRSVIETASGDIERISDSITITVTPYETALLPVIYGVGAGLPDAGWGWDSPVELLLQGSIYSSNVNLSPDNGGNFRFFAQMDWGPDSFNYPWYESRGFTIDPNLVNANDGDSNFQFVGTAGEYFLEIDMENKTITLGPPVVGPNCEFDQLWLVGAGVPDAGWGWDTPVELPCTGNGVYSGNVNLQNNGGADNNFRFFTANGDWGSGRNYPWYINDGYTIDANLIDAMDGDNNFAFIGTTGQYFLTLDAINKTIILGPPQTTCEFDVLYGVGAGLPTAGWGWTTPVEFTCDGNGVYSASVQLQNNGGADNNFRFFTNYDDWGSGRNYPWYISEGYTIDANLVDAMDGDNNFAFIGTTGTYTLTIDEVNKTITLQ